MTETTATDGALERYLEGIGAHTNISCGNPGPTPPNGDWRCSANPWTLELTTAVASVTFAYWTGPAITEDPTAAEILACVIRETLDSEDHSLREWCDFREWCDEFGYSDSHPADAHGIWQEVRANAQKLLRVLDGPEIDAVAEIVGELS